MTYFKFFTILLLSFIMALPSDVSAATCREEEITDKNSATWLWDTQKILDEADEIITFLADNKVKDLYLQIDYRLALDDYKAFIEKAAVSGISVQALEGSPEWVSEDERSSQRRFFEWLKNYNSLAGENQQFKGVHLDVEPYLNARYNINKDEILKNYQKLLSDARIKCKELGLTLGADMPFWFDEVKYNNKYGKGLLAEWVIKNLDSVVIMAYRDKAEGRNGMIKLISNEMKWGKKYGCTIIVGAETQQMTGEENISFYEEGQKYMHTELRKVYHSYKRNSSFGGFGIHHVMSWRNLDS